MTDSDGKLSLRRTITGGYRKALVIITAGVLLFVCFHGLVSSRIGFAGYGRDSFYLQDYAYHIILTKHFWFQEQGNIYDLNFQLRALSTHMEKPAVVTMPVAVTPVALLVWMPFAYIAGFSLSLAYSLWVAVSVCILALAFWKIYACLSPLRSFQVLPVVLCGITFFSLISASAIIVGQTSIFTAGIFSLIIYRIILLSRGSASFSVDWPVTLLVVLASLKPPYMIIGFGILLIYGRWREFLCSAVIVLLLTAMLSILLTAGWMRSYFNVICMYGSGNFPDIYAWSIVPRTMNIFRSAVSDLTGDQTAAVVSTILSGVTLLSIGMFSLFRSWRNITGGSKLLVALISCCLLFAPYSGAYEDMLLIPIFIIVLLTGKTHPLLTFKSMAVAGALFVCLLHNIPGLPHNLLWIFFVLKLTVLAGMVFYAGSARDYLPGLTDPVQ